jgi:hypothetical protein
MLRRRGVPVALRIGCRRVGREKQFHAWVVDGDEAILGQTGYKAAFAAPVPERDFPDRLTAVPPGKIR